MEYKSKTRTEVLTELVRLPQASKVSGGIGLLKQKKVPSQDEIKFRFLFESANDAILIMKGDRFVDCNTKAVEMYGVPRKDFLIAKTPYDFSPKRQLDGALSKDKAHKLLKAILNGVPQFTEWQHTKLDGTLFDSEVSLKKLEPSEEEFVIAIVRDVTERKRAETELRESEKRYRSLYQEFQGLLNAIPDSLTLISPDLKVVWANEGATLTFDKTVSTYVGKHCYQVWHARSKPCKVCPVQRCFRSGETEVEEVIMPDRRVWDVRAIPLLDDQGEIKGVIEVARNITERKQAEESLKQLNERLIEEHKQKKLLSKKLIQLLETGYRQISMELHDHIGQALITLKIDLDMISLQIKKVNSDKNSLIENAKKKIIQTIEDIEKIAYGLRPSMIDTLGLVPSLRDLFAAIKQHKGIEVHFFTRDIPKRFEQEKELAIFRVVQEALTNIIKHSQAKKCYVNLVKEGNSVVLSVEDDGIGFIQEKKWDLVKGRPSLGLLIMKERVEQVKGEFTLESRVGGGVHLLARIPL
jgi:PAS domain S-box-containing protein